MTAVLSPTSGFGRDMSPNDDPYHQDWRQKYIELSETLAETRADLEDFQQSSKELEEEMTLEIERTERAQHELKGKVARLETERDDWKSKFMSLQTTYNTATTSLQRELDTLRQDQQKYKVQMRELEIGNDDLERNERAVMSSLADMETKYSRVLEEKILLEQELLDKASLEEQTQRLKDELRDANEDILNLKRLLEQAHSNQSVSSRPLSPNLPPSSSSTSLGLSEDDDLTKAQPPPDLLLSELGPEPSKELEAIVPPSIPVGSTSGRSTHDQRKSRLGTGQSALLSRAGFPSNTLSAQSLNSPSSLPRSSTLPTLSPARTTPHTARGQNFIRSTARPLASALPVGQGVGTKNKGVQMISALRSRVQTTQQRLIPGIPRLRLGSTAGRANAAPLSSVPQTTPRTSSIDSHRSKENLPSTGVRRKQSFEDSDVDHRSSGAQSPGWVFIQTQDDSPFPDSKQESGNSQRRASSPTSPTVDHAPIPSSFKPLSSTVRAGAMSGIPRRPPSRLSLGSEDLPTSHAGRLSNASSLTLSDRPATPTFLPVPTFNHQGNNSKRSTDGTSASLGDSVYAPRRSSLGTAKRSASPIPSLQNNSNLRSIHGIARERPTSVPAPPRTSLGSSQAASGRASALGQSRIGKPAVGGRRSTGGESDDPPPVPGKDRNRLRAGSTTTSSRSSRS
ncbi:hypothetical protein BU17DRAFT_81226 [Hysterangium stoloniferum]|nr:hypothetical protein BU17DRAFT_81226 [Hysterangium stoloniferum]